MFLNVHLQIIECHRNKNYRGLTILGSTGSRPLTHLFDTMLVRHLVIIRYFLLFQRLNTFLYLFRIHLKQLTFFGLGFSFPLIYLSFI